MVPFLVQNTCVQKHICFSVFIVCIGSDKRRHKYKKNPPRLWEARRELYTHKSLVGSCVSPSEVLEVCMCGVPFFASRSLKLFLYAVPPHLFPSITKHRQMVS